jgi:hypothetical protein
VHKQNVNIFSTSRDNRFKRLLDIAQADLPVEGLATCGTNLQNYDFALVGLLATLAWNSVR